jgi:coenzyme F420 hydrogenase subunit beta
MCVGICPEDCFTFDDENYPQRSLIRCTDCGLCKKVCPGEDFNLEYFNQKLFGKQYIFENKLGYFNNAYVGYATDESLRLQATSGGVITSILICLLEQKEIDGAIVTVFDADSLKFKPIIARTKNELIKSAQSKYTVIPVCQIFKELKNMDGKFALVGLPCHIQAFCKLSESNPFLSDKISLIIGLYCIGTMEYKATSSLIKMMNIPLSEIKEIKYRGSEWPGVFQIFTKDGKCHSCPKSVFTYLTRLHFPKRCLTCIDYTSEFSDISVGDAWTIKNGNWKYPGGQSIVLERTERGKKALELAKSKGYINIQKILKEEAIKTHGVDSDNRKMCSIINMMWFKKRGRNFPDYGVSFPNPTLKSRLVEIRRSSYRFMGEFPFTSLIIESLAFKCVKEFEKPQQVDKLNIKRIFLYGINIFLNRWLRW